MANALITSTTNAIKVVFNDESAKTGMTSGTWAKAAVEQVHEKTDYVEVITAHGERWSVRHTANGSATIAIDSVDGVAPTSISDLYAKISALVE